MTDLSYPSAESGAFRIGSALARAIGVLRRRPGPFLLLAAAAGLPMLLVGLSADPQRALHGPLWLAILAQMAIGFLAQGAMVYGAFQEMRGQSFTLGESIAKCLGHIGPLLGAALLVSLGIMLGLVLLIVPGLMAMIAWFVAAPACVVERLGARDSISRSAALTKGYRWRVFGLVLVFEAIVLVPMYLASYILGHVAGPLSVVVLQYLFQVVGGSLAAILAAVVYHDLRQIKEGIDLDQIAGVFD
ncbi:hypothetical protein [Labrys wisconsinensis]|uniref:Membrane protein n=1 Tax=Labrys wisconsinensis TaxID=425677 RepID=A0ABU0JBZ9_9HYPH|nr:hypothetical protein [Labrys wisconsinensis]MDQ0470938.1 putative membrane protein [Labrys wisconsinensis]